jgi:hypothetical protein
MPGCVTQGNQAHKNQCHSLGQFLKTFCEYKSSFMQAEQIIKRSCLNLVNFKSSQVKLKSTYDNAKTTSIQGRAMLAGHVLNLSLSPKGKTFGLKNENFHHFFQFFVHNQLVERSCKNSAPKSH